jgi:hypothetical protein
VTRPAAIDVRPGRDAGWVRRAGAGRKAAAAKDPGLISALLGLAETAVRGDPQALSPSKAFGGCDPDREL